MFRAAPVAVGVVGQFVFEQAQSGGDGFSVAAGGQQGTGAEVDHIRPVVESTLDVCYGIFRVERLLVADKAPRPDIGGYGRGVGAGFGQGFGVAQK